MIPAIVAPARAADEGLVRGLIENQARQVGLVEVGPGQIGPGNDGVAEVGPGQVGPDQVGPGQHGALQISSGQVGPCLLYTSPSPRDGLLSRMPSSA